jgi:hypothetical protein
MHNLPVWVDYDDDLLAVPRENPCHAQYMNPQTQQAIINCLKLATYVSVSTEKLKNKYKELNKSCEVIPNALDDTLFTLKDVPPPEQREKIIFWRGSNTHMGDLMAYRDEILEVAHANSEWKWYFLGYDPWFLTEKMKPGTYGTAPWASHIEYFNLIQRMQPQVLMVPLKFDEFNQAKSHIAWLEGTLAGAAVLGPDFEEWERAGCLKYKDRASFKEALSSLLIDDLALGKSQRRELSRHVIERDYLLTDVNHLRYRVVKHLAETSRVVSK